MTPTWFSPKRVWQLVALVLSVLAAASVFLLPLFAPAGAQAGTRATAYEVAGSSVLLAVAIPLVLTLLPLLFTARAWVRASYIAAVGMILFTVTGILSFGFFFLPAAVVSVIGAVLPPPAP